MTTEPAPPAAIDDHPEHADEFAIAIAAHDIAVLVRDAPERLLWRPGSPLWALALDRGGGPDYLALDGALSIAALVWPGHMRGGEQYDLAAVARRLADDLPLCDPPGAPLLRLAMPAARISEACVRMERSALPFLARAPPTPARAAPRWRCPRAPAEAAIAAPAHAWCAWTLLVAPAEDADTFVDELDLPIDLVLLPPAWRARESLARARARLRLERCRLGVAGISEPSWMGEPAALAAAVERRLAALPATPPLPEPAAPSRSTVLSTVAQDQAAPAVAVDAVVNPCSSNA